MGAGTGFVLSAAASGGGTIGGSGTLKYVPKFTPDGTTLGNSQLYDNSTTFPFFQLLTNAAVNYCDIKLDSTTNIFFGYGSGGSNLPGSGAIDNTAFGYSAMAANTTGTLGCAFGKRALEANTVGNENCAFGPGALLSNVGGSNLLAIGHHALQMNLNANNNLAIGNYALQLNVSGASHIAVGYQALGGVTTGNASVAIGYQALVQNNGSEMVAMGLQALYANAVGNNCVAIGSSAGYSCTGSGSVFIGYNAGYSETGSNKLYISNSNTATPLILGDFSANTLVFNASIKTSQPSATGAGVWKLGKKVAAVVTLDAANYIEVAVDGVVYKLGLVS